MPDISPTVFIVDDDDSVRESLEALVTAIGWKGVAFASAEAFLTHPRIETPHCLLLDVRLPDLDGLELQQRIGPDRADMPIIFMTGYGDVPTSVQAMKAGAVEFLTKPFDDDTLLQAIRDALERSRIALSELGEVSALLRSYSALSGREREVMALVVSGLMNKQVAFELGISEITVKAHRGQVMRKMNARSLAELINMEAKIRPVPAQVA